MNGASKNKKRKDRRPMQDSNLRSPAPETDALPLGQLADLDKFECPKCLEEENQTSIRKHKDKFASMMVVLIIEIFY